MLDTAARLLQLLSLLQVRRDWSGPDLAERLGVSTRTVRNDVERLRSLGYPVNATLGASGGYRFTARELPSGGDLAAYVTRGLDEAVWRRRGRILLHAPAAQVTAKMPWGSVEPLGEDRCVAEVGSETFAMLAHYVGLLDVDFEVLEPPELAEHVRRLAARYGRAAPLALPPLALPP